VISSYLTEGDLFSASQVCHHWRLVLVSSPSLWTRISCRYAPRTIASLERCKFLPVRLRLEPPLPTATLDSVLLRKNQIASLTISREPERVPLLRQLLMLSRPSVEQLHIYSERIVGWTAEEETVHDVWQDLPSLRELFVCRYSIPIEKLTAPNLIHLALEHTGSNRNVTIQSVLDMLCGCPLLETLLIIYSGVWRGTTHDHSPVHLPNLRSLELGPYEVRCGLTTYLRFPSNVAAGFRTLLLNDVCRSVPPAVMAAMQHVLGRVDIRRITLAAPPRPDGKTEFLIRFEGLQGSLEITAARSARTHAQVRNVLFSQEGVLFSHSPRIDGVRELHIVGCSFEDGQGFYHISTAMPNLASISFFQCKGHNLLGLLAAINPSSPPFPHLERVMVLGQESGLREIAKARRDHDVPLKTLVVGRVPGGFEHDRLEDYTELGQLVDDLRIGCPTEILEWETGNEILNIWSAINVSGPVSPNANIMVLG